MATMRFCMAKNVSSMILLFNEIIFKVIILTLLNKFIGFLTIKISALFFLLNLLLLISL